ncbi:TPA: nucleotidyltransferase domain-containing protein, partial [Pasteurella multocida]|nr:nucleotidyltransferase domain-containing protein [Pasteurella multocida]
MFKNQFIVLFGSVARGDDNINSDLDILLINIDIYESENILRQYKLPNY